VNTPKLIMIFFRLNGEKHYVLWGNLLILFTNRKTSKTVLRTVIPVKQLLKFCQSPPVVKIKFLMWFICLCGVFNML